VACAPPSSAPVARTEPVNFTEPSALQAPVGSVDRARRPRPASGVRSSGVPFAMPRQRPTPRKSRPSSASATRRSCRGFLLDSAGVLATNARSPSRSKADAEMEELLHRMILARRTCRGCSGPSRDGVPARCRSICDEGTRRNCVAGLDTRPGGRVRGTYRVKSRTQDGALLPGRSTGHDRVRRGFDSAHQPGSEVTPRAEADQGGYSRPYFMAPR